MTYFARLELDLQEARASFLRSRHVHALARFYDKIAPVEERIAFLRKKLNLEMSHGLAYDGRGFTNVTEPATVAPEESKPSEDAPVEPEKAPAPEAETPAVSEQEESHNHPVLIPHPELGGEAIVFDDSEVQILNELERELNPNLLALTESAMRTLDKTKIVVSSSKLNVRDHVGMSICHLNEDGTPGEIAELFFVRSHMLSEEMSMQISQGQHRSMINVMVVSPEGNVMPLVAPSSTRWILEKRTP